MNHFYFTLFYICTFYILVAFGLDGISFVTQCLLMFFLQYKFYMLHIEPANPYEYVQQCTYCKKMTPQHYVHCSKCKKCVPVLFQHYDIIGMCVSKKTFRRYVFFKRFMLFQQTILSIIMSFNYPGLLFMVTINVYILYKSYRYDLNEIRV